jgi:predicted transposase/invertase (TIGR01784 family)
LKLQGRIFERLFHIARKDKLTPKEMETYNKSILEYNDVKNVADYAKRTGREEGEQIGRQKGRLEGRQQTLTELVIKCTGKGMNILDISDLTGLSIEQVKQILQRMN